MIYEIQPLSSDEHIYFVWLSKKKKEKILEGDIGLMSLVLINMSSKNTE